MRSSKRDHPVKEATRGMVLLTGLGVMMVAAALVIAFLAIALLA